MSFQNIFIQHIRSLIKVPSTLHFGLLLNLRFCNLCYVRSVTYNFREEKWPELAITVVISEGCRSFGDVMRDLDTKALIRSDFILLTGNIVGNLQLLPALEAHKYVLKLYFYQVYLFAAVKGFKSCKCFVWIYLPLYCVNPGHDIRSGLVSSYLFQDCGKQAQEQN